MGVTFFIFNRYDFEEWNWPVIRFGCLGVLLAIMIGLLAAVIALAIQGQAACKLNLDWWQGSLIYHINVPEFYDYDRNDIGDIRGVQVTNYFTCCTLPVTIFSNSMGSK